MSKDLNSSLCSELWADPWAWSLVSGKEHLAGGWTLPCQGGGNFCWGWAIFLFLVQWAGGVLGSGSGGEQLFHGHARGAPETAASACVSQEWSQGELWTGISPQRDGIYKFPFSDNSIQNETLWHNPSCSPGNIPKAQNLDETTFVVIWNRDLYRCDFLLFQESVGYLLGLLLNNLFSKCRSLLNYSK